ncbi:CPNE5 protein, partial [Polypterus senegalus]
MPRPPPRCGLLCCHAGLAVCLDSATGARCAPAMSGSPPHPGKAIPAVRRRFLGERPRSCTGRSRGQCVGSAAAPGRSQKYFVLTTQVPALNQAEYPAGYATVKAGPGTDRRTTLFHHTPFIFTNIIYSSCSRAPPVPSRTKFPKVQAHSLLCLPGRLQSFLLLSPLPPDFPTRLEGGGPLNNAPDEPQDSATMQFCANKLDKKDFFGKSDPFMVFYRSNEDGTFTICHKTEVVKNTLNPVWQSFSIPVRALCNGDYDRTIKVEVYDWDRDGSHDFIGEFTTSYRELARGQSQFNVYEVRRMHSCKFSFDFSPAVVVLRQLLQGAKYQLSAKFALQMLIICYEVVNPKKKMKKKKYVNSGTVTLLSFTVESEYTFLDYIKGGTQINFTVAIDFTASNGNPSQSTSLHYMNPYQMNAYAMALKAVGEIIQDYDSDKMFPALGFGAKLPPDGRVSHEFPLNGNIENPYCNGIEGILEAYHQSLKTVQLYGPTNFAPVVNHVARYAAAVQDGSQYFVLLIITDGVISDMAQTKEAIVNFVPFRDYIDRTGNHVLSMARLAKDVLAEIPDQFISYMKSRGIKPNPAPPPYTPMGHTVHTVHTQI